ncbi:division/cell wall cluster transcriptional repressor MraZ [Patescibacteria group bacterium]|nr:division/cell wall cluster transcriptional repressor MraZ [Patescibacteria group bacterium]MCL5798486.1 division/cell wall cluster transcriptional repressor MraZ [Patescibacteria group bacterium]
MFLGTYEPNLMDKGRIALPKKIRNSLGGDRIVLTTGFEYCIFGFPEESWEEVTRTELARPLFSDKEGRDLRRKMYSSAVSIDLDAQGRFVLPQEMMGYADISESLVIIGAGDHFEIWSKRNWEDYRNKL